MANVSNNYSALFGSTAKATTAPATNAAVPTASPALPAQQGDTVSLSTQATVPAANVPGARPLEVLDSIRGLNDTLEAYGQAVTDYERSRFRLLLTLGLPPEAILDPAKMPLPPEPAKPCP